MRITRPKLRAMVACLAGAGLLAAGASATEPIGDQFRVSNQGPIGNGNYDAMAPNVAHNTTKNEYLVVWSGTTGTVGELEIFGRLHTASGAPIGAPFQISTMGDDGEDEHDAFDPAAVYNATADEYYVVWSGADLLATDGGAPGPPATLDNGAYEIHGQRLDASGAQVGPDDARLSDMGPEANLQRDAQTPAVAWNSQANEYLVLWRGNDTVNNLTGFLSFTGVNGENEIWRQRVSADGVEIGADVQVSQMGPAGAEDHDAFNPAVAYNPTDNQYLVTWNGNDDVGGSGVPLSDGEQEIHGQLLSGTANPIGPAEFEISQAGPDGNDDYDAFEPSVAHNALANEYLVTWRDTADQVGKSEIRAQRISAAGAEVGPDDVRVSDQAPGDASFDARRPAVSHASLTNEYVVTWEADDDAPELHPNESEIYVQRLNAAGAQIGPDDLRVSQMGPDGNLLYRGFRPAITYNPIANEHLVVWYGDTDAAPLVDNEFEIWARRIKGAAAPGEPPPGTPPGGGIPGTNGAPSAANCADVTTITGGGASGQLTLTTTQLRINQRIGQAAVRRANAIDGWLNDGIVNDDLCGGSLVGDQLDPGVNYTQGLLEAIPGKADPRPLSIPPAQPKPGVTFQLTTEQLQINQRVYSAAVRRANALKARIEGKLTGGDITDSQLTADRLRQDLKLGALAPAAQIAAASTTDVAPAQSKNATFTLTVEQLRINQRVAQAAVKRTNELRALLGSGLKGENFAENSISAADFAP